MLLTRLEAHRDRDEMCVKQLYTLQFLQRLTLLAIAVRWLGSWAHMVSFAVAIAVRYT